MRLAGTPLAAPQVSVMPQTSSMGTPSAMYHLTRSGEIGAAPVTQKRARCMPISLRVLLSASQRASVNCSLSPALTVLPASTVSVMRMPTPMLQA